MTDATPPIPPETAKARVDRAMAALAGDDLETARAEFTDLEPRLRAAADPVLRSQWARCLNGLGFLDIMDAKEKRRATADFEADERAQHDVTRGLRRALGFFAQAQTIQADPDYRRHVLGNRAYAHALLGELEIAAPILTALFRDWGWEAYRGQKDDTRRRSVPEDAAVVYLLDEIWAEVSKTSSP